MSSKHARRVGDVLRREKIAPVNTFSEHRALRPNKGGPHGTLNQTYHEHLAVTGHGSYCGGHAVAHGRLATSVILFPTQRDHGQARHQRHDGCQHGNYKRQPGLQRVMWRLLCTVRVRLMGCTCIKRANGAVLVGHGIGKKTGEDGAKGIEKGGLGKHVREKRRI